jgi:hypothetical protein
VLVSVLIDDVKAFCEGHRLVVHEDAHAARSVVGRRVVEEDVGGRVGARARQGSVQHLRDVEDMS